MYNIGRLSYNNIGHFRPMITESALNILDYNHAMEIDERSLVIGITDDESPIACIVCFLFPENNQAEISSIFVRHQYRRQGLGTDLITSVAVILSQLDTGFVLECDVVENKEEGSNPDRGTATLRKLLEYLEFNKEEVNKGAYVCTLGDIKDNVILNKPCKKRFTRMSKLNRAERNSLADEKYLRLLEDVNAGNLDNTLSLFYTEDNEVKACLAIASDEENIFIRWVRVNFEERIYIIMMLIQAFKKAIATRNEDTKIVIPYITPEADRLLNKLLGNSIKLGEKQYHYSYSLIDDEKVMESDDEEDA